MNVPQSTAFVPPADVLSAVLRELRFESAGYRWLELGRPARVGFSQDGLRGVHIVATGSCELVDRDVHRLDAGDLVILLGGDPHVLRTVDAGTGPVQSGIELAARTPGTRLTAGGPGTAAVVVCGAFLIGEPDHPALRGLPPRILIRGSGGRTVPWLAPYVAALRTEAFDGGPGSDLVMARLSDAMLARALRHEVTTAAPGWLAGLADPHVAAAIAAVHADPGRGWTLTGLARHAGLSRTGFAARFTAHVGRPPMRYLLELRMQRARHLLRTGNEPIAVVAARVGYRSDVAFAAAFRRTTGVTPSSYRLDSSFSGPRPRR